MKTRRSDGRRKCGGRTAAVLCAAAALTLAVSACASDMAMPEPSGALTGEELAYFNDTFFNAGDFNLRNQFLSSRYDAPGDIDLYQLFYCGIPEEEGGPAGQGYASEEENRLVYGRPELECPSYRLSTADMDALLERYQGLTLAETKGVGLDSFTYQADRDAYYWAHGDTNYRSQVTFTAGERDGGRVSLYYEDTGGWTGGGWMVLTLEPQEDGGYHFLSNRSGEKPAIPTVLPEGKPELTIPLRDLEPYVAPAVKVESRMEDFTGGYEDRFDNWDIEGRNVQIYRAGGGDICAAVVAGDETWNVFLSGLSEDSRIFFFHDLFGHSGFTVTYFGYYNTSSGGTISDYYYFETDDTPILLARVHGEGLVLDLDGDGQDELAGPQQLFFQRDGSLYMADLPQQLGGAWPELSFWAYASWDRNAKRLTVTGFVDQAGQAGEARTFWRDLYFNGEDLLVYRDTRGYADHVTEGVDGPPEVIDAAKNHILSLLEDQGDGTWRPANRQGCADLQEIYDDWRLERLSGPYRHETGGVTLEAWSFNYECHTTTPGQVVLAGGKYLTEDDWVNPGGGGDWLFFLVGEDGSRHFLFTDMINDASPENDFFWSMPEARLKDFGPLSPAE